MTGSLAAFRFMLAYFMYTVQMINILSVYVSLTCISNNYNNLASSHVNAADGSGLRSPLDLGRIQSDHIYSTTV